MTKNLAVAAGFLLFGLLLGSLRTAMAQTFSQSPGQSLIEEITGFDSRIQINQDSSIEVIETIGYYFPSAGHGIYRNLPERYLDKSNNKFFRTPITVQSVQNQQNQPWEYSISRDKNNLQIKIGSANATVDGPQTYVISYKVSGVLNYFPDHDELYWNVTGSDWEVPIGPVSAGVILPDGINYDSLQLACYTGATGSKEQNCNKSFETGKADFSAAQGPLTIVVGWNKGIVTPIERKYEIQWRHESPWFWLLPLLVLIILVVKYFRTGRDPAGRGTIAPEFAPPEGLLPGEMGALVDEGADRSDITATIIDLAVRGYLKIKEKNKTYTLIKLKNTGADFKSFEKDIFEGLFGAKKEVKLKDIHTDFADKISTVQDGLYQELIKRGYFLENPNKVRGRYYLWGIIIIIVSGSWFWLSWHLVFAWAISGVLFLIFAGMMPKRTREGVIAKEKSLGFKEFLYRAERYRVKWQEKEGIFEKYLPYAMVFGIAERWAKNFQDIYKKPPGWYDGDWTTFNTVVLASSLNSFSNTASASYSPPSTSASSGSSGFGGGGSSGGGFGGGGGGSW